MHLCAICLMYLTIIALYVQRGFFEFAAIINIVLTFVVQFQLYMNQRTVFLAPIMAVERIPDIVKKSMLAELQFSALMFTTLFTVVNLGLAINCQSDVDVYNDFVLAHMCVMPAGCAALLLSAPPMESPECAT